MLSSTHCGTEKYMAPEILQKKRYDPMKADTWSLGVCLYVMLADCYPFDNKDKVLMVRKMENRDWKFPPKVQDNVSGLCINLSKRLLEPNVEKRIQMKQIPSHPWVSKTKSQCEKKTPKTNFGFKKVMRPD